MRLSSGIMNYTYKQIWLINFPVMMSMLMEQLINITDAIFLGHVGEVELGASALASVYYLAIYMLGWFQSRFTGHDCPQERGAKIQRNGKNLFPRSILFERVGRILKFYFLCVVTCYLEVFYSFSRDL